MVMSVTSVTLDGETLHKARMNNINVSKTLREALEIKLDARKGEEVLDEQLLRLKLEGRRKELTAIQMEVNRLEEQMNLILEKKTKEDEERIMKEKEELQKQKTCANCGKVLGEKMKKHKFPIGMICNGCWQSTTGEQIKEWNKGK